ncbi:hypothetical protein BHE74_00004522 [Ensete ventricosum]|nr:hypothetical protein BHE74_00004522 [Ensete ventricosum]
MATLRRKPRQPEGPSWRPIWNPRWRCPNTTLPSPRPLMWHGVPCPRPMPLQPHVLRTSRPYPEGRQRIVILETAQGTSRPSSTSRTPEGASIHAGSFDPHRRWRTCALGREQVEPTPQLDS